MPLLSARFLVNAPDTASETFDEEVLAINLRNGTYYSLRASAVAIWAGLTRGWCVQEIAAQFLIQPADGTPIGAAVHDFVGRLESEGLIVKAPADFVPAESPPGLRNAPFTEPLLEKYSDLRGRILCYAVETENATGWPAEAPSPVSTAV